jgi:hypothetical protein
VAIALALGVIVTGDASALTVTSIRDGRVSAHEHHCRCKGCRGSCCCDPSDARSPTSDPRPSVDLKSCLNALPCDGGAGLPAPGHPAPVGKTALPPGLAAPARPESGRWMAPPAALSLPSGLVARLDDPPEPCPSV